MTDEEIPDELYGWWRITETSQWVDDGIDIIGTPLISITGNDDRSRNKAKLCDIRQLVF